MTTFGKALKSGSPKSAPIVRKPSRDKPFSHEKDIQDKKIRRSSMLPLKSKRLSK